MFETQAESDYWLLHDNMGRSLQLFLVCLHGILVLALAGCGQSKEVSDAPPAQIHGDLIAPPTVAQPKPIAVAVVNNQPTPAVNASTTTTVPAPALRKNAAVAPLANPIAAPNAPAKTDISSASDYLTVGFDKLASYNFEVDTAPATNVTAATDKANDQIPPRVKAFDDKKVSITGFMLPLKVSNGKVTEFLIMKDQSLCCFGSVPKITEWVSVKTPDRGVKSIMDEPVSIEGTLHIGAMRENGYLIGIYHMDGDKLIAPNE